MFGTRRSALRAAILEQMKSAARRLGIEVKRRRNELDEANVLSQVLAAHPIDLVIDVGANQGQFAHAMRLYGYRGPIVSFEPLPDAHASLLRTSAGDRNWTIAPRMALGAEAGQNEIHIAQNSASSSLLPMLKAHSEAAPHSEYVGTTRVQVERLDKVLPGQVGQAHAALLKIDTQGYEDRVLAGATGILGWCSAILLEMSLVPLYAGQADSTALIRQLGENGYRLSYLIPGFHHPNTGRLLQFDAVFVRSDPGTCQRG